MAWVLAARLTLARISCAGAVQTGLGRLVARFQPPREAPSPGPALVMKKLSPFSAASCAGAGCNANAQSAIEAQTNGIFFITVLSILESRDHGPCILAGHGVKGVSRYALYSPAPTLGTSKLSQSRLSDRPGDVAHASRRAVAPFLATCLVGAPALLLGGGMPARMPAQHAESVRHLAFETDVSESIVDSSPGQSTNGPGPLCCSCARRESRGPPPPSLPSLGR